MTHALYIAKSATLDATVLPGFVTFRHGETRRQVVPKGDGKLRRRAGYTVEIVETLSVECEDIGLDVPKGPVPASFLGVQAATGDDLGDDLTVATRAAVTGPPAVPAGTVEVTGVERDINGDGTGRMRLTLEVNSPDGFLSGLAWTYPS